MTLENAFGPAMPREEAITVFPKEQLGGNVEMQVKAKIDTNDQKFDHKKAEIERQVLKDRNQVVEAGGLYVLATERHESRRIDNQLRGRSGRQGDPGKTTFFLSLDDDLLRIFGSDKLDGMLSRLGLKDGESIAHPWVSKALERAQGKVEARNFDLRKNILKYDDVVNVQRKEIFSQRRNIMEAADVTDMSKTYTWTSWRISLLRVFLKELSSIKGM